MKNKSYVRKTVTLTCDSCKTKIRVKKADLDDRQLNAIYNPDECLCDHCIHQSPKALDFNFIRYNYFHSKVSFSIFPKIVSIEEIKAHKEIMTSAKKLSNALLDENFGKTLEKLYWQGQMRLKKFKIIK